MIWSWKRDCHANSNPKRWACLVTADLQERTMVENKLGVGIFVPFVRFWGYRKFITLLAMFQRKYIPAKLYPNLYI